MRYIEELRDRHKSEEIWVLGSGPSLDDFPPSFFDNKISIALNEVIGAFPNCTYMHCGHSYTAECAKDYLEILQKCIFLYPLIWQRATGNSPPPPDEWLGELVDLPIWMRWYDTRPVPSLEDFRGLVDSIMSHEDKCFYRCSMSVLHSAIEASVVLGAKRVTLAGCEHRFSRHGPMAKCVIEFISGLPREYAPYGVASYWTEEADMERWERVMPRYGLDPRIRNGTEWLAQLFGEHGIPVERYFYRDGEYYMRGYCRVENME